MAGNGWTEGPWEYIASTEHHGPYVMASWGGDICDCYTMSNLNDRSVRNGGDSKPIHFQHERADANARLIAAAPDGFLVAESAYRLLLRVPHDLPLRFLNQSVYAALLDYIAKALGEEAEKVQDRYEAEARGDQPDSDPPIPNSATPQGA